jgi:uncharacterized protein
MIKCFYHVDLDGFASGAIVKKKHPEAEMYKINYGYPFPWETIDKNDTVYMVDFALQPFDNMLKLADMCNLIWIDHHKGVLEDAEKHYQRVATIPGIRKDGTGACILTWIYCFPDIELPSTVKLLGEYDVWNFSDIRTMPFQYGMRLKQMDPGISMDWWNVFLKKTMWEEEVIKDGEVILAYETQMNKEYITSYGFDTILPVSGGNMGIYELRALCVNKGRSNLKLFESVCDESKYDIMITFCRIGTPINKWTVSLYSTKPEIDCSAIAKSYGGNGHKGAAGFQCEKLPFVI